MWQSQGDEAASANPPRTSTARAEAAQEMASPLPATPPAQQPLLYPQLVLKSSSSRKGLSSLARAILCGFYFWTTLSLCFETKSDVVLAGHRKQTTEAQTFRPKQGAAVPSTGLTLAGRDVGDAHVPDLLLLRLPSEVVLKEEPFARDVSRVLPILVVVQVLGNFFPDFILDRFSALLSKS